MLLCVGPAAEASMITFFDQPGTGVSFATDNPSDVTPFDCSGDTFYCIVQSSIPDDIALAQCRPYCFPVIASLDGITVAAVFTIRFGGGNTDEPFVRFGYFSQKLAGHVH
jgi:hypothetical protein